jgi:hypothetical protein
MNDVQRSFHHPDDLESVSSPLARQKVKNAQSAASYAKSGNWENYWQATK